MVTIPYGQAGFKALIKDGFYYLDRTQYIEKLERQSSYYPVFLRPRRFGQAAAVRPSAAIPPRRRNDRRSAVTPRAGSEIGAFMANIQHRIRKQHPAAR